MAIFLYVAVALLFADGIIELGFLSTMVRWVSVTAGAGFRVNGPDGEFLLAGKPLNFPHDQGHASNGAAGSCFIVVGLGGALALYLRHRQLKRNPAGELHGFPKGLYTFWLYYTAVNAVYVLACFIYTFVETYRYDGQHIDLQFASTLNSQPYPNTVPYPRDTWTPQGWFPAVLELPLASQESRDSIKSTVTLIRGWQWNLIPLTILAFTVATLAFINNMRHKQHQNKHAADSRLEAARQKPGSPWSQ